MSKSIVGVFDDVSSAQTVVRELKAAGIPENYIQLTSNEDAEAAPSSGEKKHWSDRIFRLFGSLFEDDDDRTQASHYAEAWRRGHFIVVADVEDNQADQVVEIMNRYGSVDVEQRVAQWKTSGYSGSYDVEAPAYTAEQRKRELAAYPEREAIPVVQEDLAVGKRVVQRGGVRIHSYVEERPVAERVQLREELVSVERRPADRPATETDAAFKERTIDVIAQAEEPVVEKRARVVEEVVVGKDVTEREETISDTVRRKDVDVERVADSKTKTAATAKQAPADQPRR